MAVQTDITLRTASSVDISLYAMLAAPVAASRDILLRPVSAPICVTSATTTITLHVGASPSTDIILRDKPNLSYCVSQDIVLFEPTTPTGAAGPATRTGTLAATETPDTFASTGDVCHVGTLAATETADIFAAVGDDVHVGALAVTEAADTFAADGDVTPSAATTGRGGGWRKRRRVSWWDLTEDSRAAVIARIVETVPMPAVRAATVFLPKPAQIVELAEDWRVKVDARAVAAIRARVERIVSEIASQDEDDLETLLVLM